MSSILIPYYTEVVFHFPDTISPTDSFPMSMPYDGEILGYAGSIAVLGTGAGTKTEIQVANQDTGINYFTTRPAFYVDSASKLIERGVLIDSPTFRLGQELLATVIAISTNPEDAQLRLLCKFFKRVDV